MSLALQADSLLSEPAGKPQCIDRTPLFDNHFVELPIGLAETFSSLCYTRRIFLLHSVFLHRCQSSTGYRDTHFSIRLLPTCIFQLLLVKKSNCCLNLSQHLLPRGLRLTSVPFHPLLHGVKHNHYPHF